MRTLVAAALVAPALCSVGSAAAQNPLVMDQFTADPTARVFEGRVYVYPSHDVDCGTDWFCMRDYHVFSSEDLVEWTDHGVILSQDDVAWVDASSDAMWAPDAIEKDGRYLFYFPSIADSTAGDGGRRIGVATADTPYGPFTPAPEPIAGVEGIDPNVFVDHDGRAYLYWAEGGGLRGARLDDRMTALASKPVAFDGFPEGFKEGPFVFEREGTYYLTFPHVRHETEALAYATGDHPLGPFEYRGVFMEEHASGCWTNHHSVAEVDGQWVLFYHHNDLSPGFDKNRSIRADSLFFGPDGAIEMVTPTNRGVGVVSAQGPIQVDRYSHTSGSGVGAAFVDPDDPFAGWALVLSQEGAWGAFERVEVGEGGAGTVALRVRSASGAALKVRVGDGGTYASSDVAVPPGDQWQIVRQGLAVPPGVHDLWVSLRSPGRVEVDWVQFE